MIIYEFGLVAVCLWLSPRHRRRFLVRVYYAWVAMTELVLWCRGDCNGWSAWTLAAVVVVALMGVVFAGSWSITTTLSWFISCVVVVRCLAFLCLLDCYVL